LLSNGRSSLPGRSFFIFAAAKILNDHQGQPKDQQAPPNDHRLSVKDTMTPRKNSSRPDAVRINPGLTGAG